MSFFSQLLKSLEVWLGEFFSNLCAVAYPEKDPEVQRDPPFTRSMHAKLTLTGGSSTCSFLV